MKTVFFDIDTQIDFVFPSGALYAKGAEKLVPTLAKLNHYAAKHHIPVVSTMDAHSENDPEFKEWPHHCVIDTLGQTKPASTLLEKRVAVPNNPIQLHAHYEQVLLEKQTFSALTNVNFANLLKLFAAERYVVYGVVTEVCVKFAAMGLLETGKRVEIVTDAICALNEEDGAKTLADFTAAGGHLTQAGTIYA